MEKTIQNVWDKALEIIDRVKYVRKEDTGNIGGAFCNVYDWLTTILYKTNTK